LKITWNNGAGENFSTASQFEQYQKLAATKGTPAGQKGDVADALSKTNTQIKAEYIFPYLAHAPMEPLNCTVKLSGNSCEIWTGTQMPGVDQAAAAAILGLKPEQVKLNIQFLGGAFGRRATPTSDFVSEAVQVAKASKKLVKLVWSREDDIRGGYYRPACLDVVPCMNGLAVMLARWRRYPSKKDT
jgi:isoquinoline 1-oxidoreductase beta subunit